MQNYSRVLTRPYLLMLYVIFPIHLNYPIRSRCVFKAAIQRKKAVLQLLEKVFSFSKRHFSHNLVLFFVFLLSIMYLLFSPYHILYRRLFLNICKEFCLYQFSSDIFNIWKNLFF